MDAFLQRWRGTYQEDRLRNDWLLLLGQRRAWADFDQQLADFRMRDDKEVRCYELAVQTIEGRAAPETAEEVLRLWYGQRDGDDGCTYAASELYAAQQLKDHAVWKRARIAAEANRQTAVRRAVAIVAPDSVQHVAEVFASPSNTWRAPAKCVAIPAVNWRCWPCCAWPIKTLHRPQR